MYPGDWLTVRVYVSAMKINRPQNKPVARAKTEAAMTSFCAAGEMSKRNFNQRNAHVQLSQTGSARAKR